MEAKELIEILSCQNSRVVQHVLEEPIALDCGHCICKSCAPKSVRIKCDTCGEITKRDLKDLKGMPALKKMIQMNLNDLCRELEKQTSENLEKLKRMLNLREETIDININYIEEEIQIRIESVKSSLDEMLSNLKIKMADFKNQILKETMKQAKAIDMKYFENNLNELRNYLKNNESINEDHFYNQQDVHIKIGRDIKNLEASFDDLKIKFVPSSQCLDEKFIGHVYFKTRGLSPMQVTEILTSRNFFKSIETQKFLDNAVLPESQILFSSRKGPLELHDGELNLIKTVDEFDNRKIKACGIANDDSGARIYISDYANDQIIMTDMKLNFVKSFGSRGINNKRFHEPLGICFNNDRLYVCDYQNERIQIFDSGLEYFDTLKLDYLPHTIKILNDTIGICGNRGTFFYNKNTKKLESQYAGRFGRINVIGNHFYVFSYKPEKTLLVFDANGSLVHEISVDRFANNIASYWDAHFSVTNNALLVTFESAGETLNFKIVE